MVKKNGLAKLSLAALSDLRRHIDGLMAEKQGAKRKALRAQMGALARKHGYDVREIVGGRRKASTGGVTAKYRDPNNPENTWSGRGRPPRWIAKALKGGKAKKEDFLV
jgi:DNA-binding protein H-NS